MLREIIPQVTMEMAAHYTGNPERIRHFMKVWGYARTIGQLEHLDRRTQLILELAALTHGIGDRGQTPESCTGEQPENPTSAEALLARLGYPKEIIQRVCWLIDHHRICGERTSPDCQILIEADFLANLDEGNLSPDGAREKIFRTESGTALLDALFPQAN